MNMGFKKGYKQTEEHRKRIIESIRLQHKLNPNYGMKGKKHLEKTKVKMSKSKLGKKMSEEHKKNWMDSMKKLKENGKIIIWNKGLTPRIGKYKNNHYKTHQVYRSQKDNLPYIPKGMVIHHIDLNPSNDKPCNLIMMDKSTHHKLHNKICLLIRK